MDTRDTKRNETKSSSSGLTQADLSMGAHQADTCHTSVHRAPERLRGQRTWVGCPWGCHGAGRVSRQDSRGDGDSKRTQTGPGRKGAP